MANPLTDRDILTWAMRAGLTQDEIRSAVRSGLESGAIPRQTVHETDQERINRLQAVQDYLMDRYMAGYTEYQQTLQPNENAMAEWQWRNLPPHARLRYMNRIPYEQGQEYGPEWVRRQGQEHLFNIRAVTEGSFLGHEGLEVLATFEPSKIMKRIQMLGAHETVNLSGVETFEGYMKAGPASPTPDAFQRVRSAFIIGGEPGAPGQGYMDPSVGLATSRRVVDVFPEIGGPELSGLARKGQQWLPGEQVQLAEQLAGFTDRSWGYQVADYAPITQTIRRGGQDITQQGYRYVLDRMADLSAGRLRVKAFSSKSEAVRMPLGDITDVEGRSLGIQFAGAIKDVQGTIYSHYMARDPHYLAEAIGVPVENLPGSYAELGADPMRAFAEKFVNRHVRTIRWPATVHESQLEQYRPVMVGEPTPIEGQPGMYRIQREYQALVDDLGLQVSRDYSVKSPFLNRTELEHLKRQQSDVYRQVMLASKGQRRAYAGVINAALSTTGEYELPRRAASLTPSAMQGYYTQAVEAARERLGIEDLSPVPRHAINQELFDILGQSEIARNPLVFNRPGGGRVVVPAPRDMSYFRAAGKYLGQEVSSYVGALADVFASAGTGEVLDQALGQLAKEQTEIAGAKHSVRRMTGAFVSGDLMAGDIARSSAALAPWEAYIPSMGEAAFNIARFPTQGEETWSPGMRTVGLSREEAVARGLDPEAMYVSEQLMQALAGDNDGDLIYALKTGELTRNADGHIYDQSGQRLDTSDRILKAAEEAVNNGAGRLRDELVGQGAPAPTLEEAREMVRQQALNPKRLTVGELSENIQEGMGLYEQIGPYYNTGVRGMANIPAEDAPARAAMQKFWNISHGRAQRPQKLTPGAQHIQDLMTYKFDTSGVYQKGAGRPGKLPQPGLSGLMTEATRGLLMENLSSEQFAALMAPPEARQAVAAAHQRYRTSTASRGERLSTLMSEMQAAMGGEMAPEHRWATGAAMGKLLGGQATRRFVEAGGDPGTLTRQFDIPQGVVAGLTNAAARSERQVDINRKEKRTVQELAATIENARAEGVHVPGGLVRPNTQAAMEDTLPETPIAPTNGTGWQFVSETGTFHPHMTAPAGGGNGQPPGKPPVAAAPVEPENNPEEPPPTRKSYQRGAGVSVRQEAGWAPMDPEQLHAVGLTTGLWDPNKDIERVTIRRDHNNLFVRKVDDSERVLKGALKKIDAYDYATQRALAGEPVEDEVMLRMFERAGLTASDLGGLRQVSQAMASGQVDEKSLNALRKASFRYSGLRQDVEKAGGMDLHLAPYDLQGQLESGVAGMSRQLGGTPKALKQVRAIDEISQRFGDMADHILGFNEAIDKTAKTMGRVNDLLDKDFRNNVGEYLEEVRTGRQRLRVRGQRLDAMMKSSAEGIKLIEEHGLEGQYGRRYQTLKEQYARAAAEKGRMAELGLSLDERELEAIEEGGRRQYRSRRNVGRIFGLAMLPWQLQFAKQWGTQQAEQALTYAAGVDTAFMQAGFASGFMPPSAGMAEHIQQQQAAQGWGQYYMGQGAAQSAGGGAFLAGHPTLARGLGAAANYGQYLGYGLAAELAVQQMTEGRGLFVGDGALLRTGTMGQLAGAGAVLGAGYLGVSATVDVLNAVQGRTRTTKEGVREAARNLMRGGAIVEGFFGRGVQNMGRALGVGFLEQAGGALATGVTQLSDLPEGNIAYTGELEAERRDREIQKSAAYRRQQAIMDQLKVQGLTPEQAGVYANLYARAGITDPARMAQLAGQAFKVEQYAGLGQGTLINLASSLASYAGQLPGQGNMAESLQANWVQMAEQNPQGFNAYFSALQQQPDVWGAGIYKLGLSAEQNLGLMQHTAQMQAAGANPWELQQYTQSVMLSTPRAWSERMRQWGYSDLALVDDLGRPVNYAEQEALQGAERIWGRARTQFGFNLERRQIAAQEDWMQRSWAIEDQVNPLRQRYRIEDADMNIARLALRLEEAQGFGGRTKADISRELFEKQIGWREADIQTSMARAATQREWQLQDFAWERNTFDLQRGWRLQDLDEAIRYASGRQRIKLMEQRERAVQMSNIQSNRMDEQEQRAGVQYGWGQEDRQKQLERLKEEADLRREMMGQDEEAQKRSLELLKQQYEQAVQRRKELVETIIPAEEKSEKLEREKASASLQWRKERQAMDETYFKAIQPLQDALTEKTKQMKDAWTIWQTAVEKGLPQASTIFLKEFGPDSDAFQAMDRWLKMLNEFGQKAGGSGATGNMGNMMNRAMENYMRSLFERAGIPLPF